MAQKIKAVEMTRNIRERNHKRLQGMSRAKRLAFYREQAKRMNAKAARLTKTKKSKLAHA